MDRDHWANLARVPGLHPYYFFVTTELGPQFNVSFEGQCSFDSIVSRLLYWGIRTHTDNRVSTPCWLQ